MNVILYCRVSSDEQKKTGHSPQDQEAKLVDVANRRSANIVRVFHEDFSAKTFDRPEWKKIIELVKRHPGLINEMWVLKWTRFSRNIEESYRMLRWFRERGVEINATEEPIDFSQPNSKFMLAFYLTHAEVDNDNRSIDTTNGMRRAQIEGIWANKAPSGYKNIRDEKGRALPLAVDPVKAPFIIKTFDLLKTGSYTIDQCMREIRALGWDISKSHFHRLIHNVVYAGKIQVKAYKKDPAQLIDAKHEPLVSEEVFYTVQDILNGRKKKQHSDNDKFPLKGILICANCGQLVRASNSTGKLGVRYGYYHCESNACKHRHRSDLVEDKARLLLQCLKKDADTREVFSMVLEDVLKQKTAGAIKSQGALKRNIETIENRIITLENGFMDGTITPNDYQGMRARCQGDLNETKAEQEKANQITALNRTRANWCSELIDGLDLVYDRSPITTQRQILGSIFPEKLEFTGKIYRTQRVNSIMAMYMPSNMGVPGILEIKNIQESTVMPYGTRGGTILEHDLALLYELHKVIDLKAA